MVEQHRYGEMRDRRIRMAEIVPMESIAPRMNRFANLLATAVLLGFLPVAVAIWMGWI